MSEAERLDAVARQAGDLAVVIPVCNASRLVDQALASAAAQTVQPAAVLLIDDASTDDTSKVAAAWQGRLPLTILRTEASVGPAAARHQAISETDAPLVALLDPEDYWFPDHLESMLACYASGRDLITADPLPWISGRSVAVSPTAQKPLPPPGGQLAALLQGNFVSGAALFSRELYDQVGGFRSHFLEAGDWDLWIRMVRSGAKISRLAHCTLLYRLPASTVAPDELRQVDLELAVLTSAAAEAASADEQAAARRGLRRLRARRQYLVARSLAVEGKRYRARLTAVRGLAGGRRTALRSSAVLVAPGQVASRVAKSL